MTDEELDELMDFDKLEKAGATAEAAREKSEKLLEATRELLVNSDRNRKQAVDDCFAMSEERSQAMTRAQAAEARAAELVEALKKLDNILVDLENDVYSAGIMEYWDMRTITETALTASPAAALAADMLRAAEQMREIDPYWYWPHDEGVTCIACSRFSQDNQNPKHESYCAWVLFCAAVDAYRAAREAPTGRKE